MTRHLLYLLGSTALIAACTSTEPPKFVRAHATEPPKLDVLIEPETVPAFQQTLKPLPAESDHDSEVQGLDAIEAAHADALIQSAPDGFINASQYFSYQEGALYELHTAPGYITTIALEPGEQLVNYAVGDTARWVVGDIVKGDQTLLLVKPTKPRLSTNLVITTNRRIYLLETSSHQGATYNASVAWTYPLDSLSHQIAAVDAANERNADTIVAGVPLDQLNFDYTIEGDKPRGGSGPRWRPVRAFDDGAKVYIEFPRNLATSEAPPLFVTDESGDGQLVNYRAKERYYVVDRLFDLAELRLDDTVVSISKNGIGGSSWKRWLTTPPERKSLRRDPDDHGEQHDRNERHGRSGHHDMDSKHGA